MLNEEQKDRIIRMYVGVCKGEDGDNVLNSPKEESETYQ